MPSLPPPPTTPVPQGEHILVVDDIPVMADLIAGYLREAGYAVEICHSAEKAWESICLQLPVFLITGELMPGIDGRELCSQVDHLEHVYGRTCAVLSKPFKPKELLAFVDRILRNTIQRSFRRHVSTGRSKGARVTQTDPLRSEERAICRRGSRSQARGDVFAARHEGNREEDSEPKRAGDGRSASRRGQSRVR